MDPKDADWLTQVIYEYTVLLWKSTRESMGFIHDELEIAEAEIKAASKSYGETDLVREGVTDVNMMSYPPMTRD